MNPFKEVLGMMAVPIVGEPTEELKQVGEYEKSNSSNGMVRLYRDKAGNEFILIMHCETESENGWYAVVKDNNTAGTEEGTGQSG